MEYETNLPEEHKRCGSCGAWMNGTTHKRTEQECAQMQALNINDTVRERPDEAGECRFTGKIVGFSEVYGQKLVIVLLDVGFFSDFGPNSSRHGMTPLYTSLLVVHPSNLLKI